MTTARCRSCAAPITWARTAKGRRIPLDPEPVPDGNITVRQMGLELRATVHAADQQLTLGGEEPGERYVSHFVTCEFAGDHRRRRR